MPKATLTISQFDNLPTGQLVDQLEGARTILKLILAALPPRIEVGRPA